MKSLFVLISKPDRIAAPRRFAFASRAVVTLVASACAGLQPLHSATLNGTQGALNNKPVIAPVGEPLIDRHDFINTQKSHPVDDRVIQLEQLFLICDDTASVGMLDAHEMELCPVVTEQLRFARFEGDLERLLAWRDRQREAKLHALDHVDGVGECGLGDKP